VYSLSATLDRSGSGRKHPVPREVVREVQRSGREQRFIDAINNVAVLVGPKVLNRRLSEPLHTVTARFRCEGREISF
jgi:hypothetical protein